MCCGSCVPVTRSRRYTSARTWLTTTTARCLPLTSFCSLLTTHYKAGLLHLYLGDRWPPWTAHLLSSAAVSSGITFYFLGPPLVTHGCANCAWMPVDEAALDSRIEAAGLVASEWEYRDVEGEVHGAFSSKQMLEWWIDEHFDGEFSVTVAGSEEWGRLDASPLAQCRK